MSLSRADDFFVWSHNSMAGRHACTYYRIEVPLGTMAEKGYIKLYMDHGKQALQEESVHAMMYSDVIQLYAQGGADVLHRIRTVARRKPAVRDGELIVPPATIYDHDDNCDFVHPFNSTFCVLGTRSYPDGKLLEPGDVLQFEDAKGDMQTLWVDGETQHEGVTFDIQRNLHEMLIRHLIIKESDGATVPSRALARYFRDVVGQKNVYIFPNTIVPEDYVSYDLNRHDDKVRILWQGGNSHYVDWYPLREPLKAIVEKYRDKVRFVIWGQKFNWVHDIIPEDMIEYHDWSLYEAYKMKRALLNIDINLCPLVDNAFNRCKSAIKWYEASVWDKPEATLAQNTEPYHEIEDNVTGLLFNTNAEFVEKLSALIESAELRKRLAQGAHDWLFANRTPEKTIPGLFEFYEDTRARQKRERTGQQIKVTTMDDLKKLEAKMR